MCIGSPLHLKIISTFNLIAFVFGNSNLNKGVDVHCGLIITYLVFH